MLYETHSMLETENGIMVSTTVDDINRAALAYHIKCYKERRRQEAIQEQNELDAEALERMQNSSKRSPKARDDVRSAGTGGGGDGDSDSSSDERESDSEVFKLPNTQLGLHYADEEYHFVKVGGPI